jgi:hypothetical protein
MHNVGFIKQASVELSNLDNKEVVKVAGVLRDIKNWFKGLVNPEFKTRVNELKRDSFRIRKLIRDLDKYLENIDTAINNGDVVKYNDSLEMVKYIVKTLSSELEELSESVDIAKVPEKITEKVKTETKEEIPQVKTEITEDILQKRDRVKEVLKTVNENDLPEGIAHVGDILGGNNLVMSSNFDNSYSLRKRIIGQIVKAYSDNDTFGNVENVSSIVNTPGFFEKIRKATGEGVVEAVHYRAEGDPGLIGDYIYSVYTPPIHLDNIPMTFQLVVQVVDQTYNARRPKPVRVMRLVTNLKNPLKMGPTLSGRAVPAIKSKNDSDVSNVEDVNNLSDDWYLTREGILEMTSRYNKSNYVPAKRTEISKEQLTSSLKSIWPTVFKEYEMTDKGLDIITAHINLETGNTKSMFNYNFGNVKATPEWSQNHKWTSYAAGETLNGKTYKFTSKHPMAFFRAFDTLEEGISYYLQTIGSRYKDALESAIEGDVKGFSNKLHEKGYYTADPKQYTSGMKRILGEPEDEDDEDPSTMQQAYELAKALGVNIGSFASNNLTDMVVNSIRSETLPKQESVIKIKANSKQSMITYAYILSDALSKDIDSDIDICGDEQHIEVNCKTAGKIQIINSIGNIISESFYKKYGENVVFITKSGKSKYPSIKSDNIERGIRRFFLNGYKGRNHDK